MSIDLFSENILDYYRNPRNKGVLAKPDLQARDTNPLCGDAIALQLQVSKGVILRARFEGTGCAISQASASLLAEKLEGMAVKQAAEISSKEVLEMLGIPVNGQRLKCALLSLHVLKKALSRQDDYLEIGTE